MLDFAILEKPVIWIKQMMEGEVMEEGTVRWGWGGQSVHFMKKGLPSNVTELQLPGYSC